jgi:hypothetical protein
MRRAQGGALKITTTPRVWIGFAATIVIMSGFLAFQNCSSTPTGSLFDAQDLSTVAQEAPFAYDATVDQIAYMSCSEMDASYDHTVFFSLKAGAYTSGGLRMSSAFKNFLLTLPTTDSAAEILATSTINSNVSPQLDFNMPGSFQTRINLSLGLGGDFNYLLTPLSNSDVTNVLLATPFGQRIRVIPESYGSPQAFETVLDFNTSDAEAIYVRNYLTNTAMMTMVFVPNDGSGNQPPISPVGAAGVTIPVGNNLTASETVYGRGFRVAFGTPSPSDFGQTGTSSTAIGNRVLSSINESNLNILPNDGDGPFTWTCPVALRMKVVRPEDAASFGCVMAADPTPLSANLQTIRYSLPNSMWYVDMTHRCVVQKTPGAGACYGAAATKVNYNLSQTCAPDDATNGSCAHFLSICYR